jgi:hypothetical protein
VSRRKLLWAAAAIPVAAVAGAVGWEASRRGEAATTAQKPTARATPTHDPDPRWQAHVPFGHGAVLAAAGGLVIVAGGLEGPRGNQVRALDAASGKVLWRTSYAAPFKMDKAAARQWLEHQGVTSQSWLDDVLGGFDFAKPVYEQHLSQGDVIYQYIRNPGHENMSPMRGSWFCLRGAPTKSLAISEGLSGRRLHKFKVQLALVALEGIAAYKAMDWSWAGGGTGGATQLFVPPSQIARVRAVASQEPW